MGLWFFCLVAVIYCCHGWAQKQDQQVNEVSNQQLERFIEDYGWIVQNGCPLEICREYEPVCGSNGFNYPNKCRLNNAARCFDSSITLKHYGRCKDSKKRSLVSDTPCNWPSGEHFWPHPTNCLMYVHCGPSGPVERPCPAGTAWSQSLQGCDHLYKTDCDPSIPQRPDGKERSLVSDTPCNWPSGEHFWPHPTNCLMYVHCGPSGPVERPCPAGTAWSQNKRACDHLHNTDCDPSKPQRPDDKECDDSEPATYNGCNRCWCQGGHQVCTQMRCPQQ